MPFCASSFSLLAGQLYSGVGAPPSSSVGFISGWLSSSGNLGDLNTKLSTSFYLSGDSPCIAGDFGAEEQAIYQLMYMSTYWVSAAQNLLAAGGTTPWVELVEGDTRVRRESTAERAKVYMSMAKAAQEDLWYGIACYKQRITVPQTVDAASLASYPTP